MHISQLSLHGFKSFAKSEKLMFHEGITAVVGPNGCGKTNIVDAIRWVLGEQKYSLLRGARIDDIIFNGSDSKKPLNVCQVSLLIHNTGGKLPVEYTDVEISRRAFRNGESEYMINRTPCRLKDVQTLFIDTGMGADAYSVIELKMIEDILSDNADDRRKMFEEAAGINQYKHQRKTALTRLEAARGDLDRISDIMVEVEKRVDALRLQLKRFDRHRHLTEKLQGREIELAFLRKRQIKRKLDPLARLIADYRRQHSTRLDEEKGREAHLEELQKAYRKQREELSQVQKDLDDLAEKRQDSNNRILILKEQIKSTERSQERLQVERKENKEKKESLAFQTKELGTELENLSPRIEQKNAGYEEARTALTHEVQSLEQREKHLEHLRSRRLEYLKELNSTRSNLERTQEVLDERRSRLSNMEGRVRELETHMKKQEASQKEMEGNRKALRNAISRSRKELEKLDTRLDGLRSQKHELSLEFHRIAGQVETLESQLQFYREIVESKEGYPSGVRHVLSHLNDYPGVLGSVADLIEVEERYRLGVEAGLGPFSRCLVCKTRKGALKVLDDLDALGMGSVSIIPLDSVARRNVSPMPVKGGVPATKVVTAHKSAESLIPYLLGNLVLVEDASSARTLWNRDGFEGNIADLSGRCYDGNGVIRSLKGEGEVSVLGRKDKMEKLDGAIDDWIARGNKTQGKLSELGGKLKDLEKRHQDLSETLGGDIDRLAEVEKQIAHDEFAISQGVENLKGLTHEIVLTRKEILSLEKNLDQLVPRVNELEAQNNTFEEKIEQAKGQVEEGKKMVDGRNVAVQEARMALISIENDRDNVEYRLETVEESMRQLDGRRMQLREETDRNAQEIAHLGEELEAEEKALIRWNAEYKKQKSLKDLKSESLQEAFDQIEEVQGEIRRQQRDRERVGEELKRSELEISDYRGQLERLEGRIREKYRMAIPDSLEVNLNQDELSLEIDTMERSLERIGPINMAVKQEYDAESERLEFFQKQRKDLLESEADLLETVGRIDKAARKQFLDTFEKIRENFHKTFTLFFEGGEGDLFLKGDDDPLESDIFIQVTPPGKHTRNLRLLSSGEKALSAVALLFAIYQVKPSPFCVLDEVDAPLDDRNIRKFTRALREFSRDTQFIVVTHNKLTMEAARYLYGVTMEQSGISKIVSVKFD